MGSARVAEVTARHRHPGAPPARRAGEPVRRTNGRLFGLVTACAVQFLSILDTLVVSVALPATAREFHLGPAGIQWMIGAYTISFAGFVLLGGRVADLVGQRRALLGALTLLAVGAVVGATAGHELALFAGRSLQGIGAAVAMPASVALITTGFSDGAQRHRAFGAWGASGGAALITGGLLGGVITAQFGWRAVFWFMLPLFAITGYLANISAPDRPRPDHDRGVNLLGAAFLALCFGTLVYTTTRGQLTGWLAPGTVLGYATTFGLGAGFVLTERRSRSPLVRRDLLRLANVRAAGILGVIFPAAFIAPLFLGSLLLQAGLEFDAFTASLALLPFSLAVVVGTTVAPRLMAWIGGRLVAAGGFGFAVAGLLLMTIWESGGYGLAVLPGFGLAGLGAAIASVPLSAASVSQIPDTRTGMATGLFVTFQQAGNALVTAVLAVVVASFGVRVAGAGSTREATVAGLAPGFGAAAAICLVAMIGAVLLLPDTRSGDVRRRTPVLTREE